MFGTYHSVIIRLPLWQLDYLSNAATAMAFLTCSSPSRSPSSLLEMWLTVADCARGVTSLGNREGGLKLCT